MPSETAPPVPATDAELLMRFVEHQDYVACRSLAERQAGLVARVCRRVLWDEQDVEDACQATLMVLARRADSIRCRESIAGWLFRVARRTATRAARLRVRTGERPLPSEPTTTDDTLDRLQSREACEILAAELERLPEHYRTPLILLYLEGKSLQAAAEELDCTHAALKGRVARARRMLRERLLRRGVALSVVLSVWLRGTDALAAVTLTDQSIQSAIHYGATGRLGPGCRPNSLSLAKGATSMPTVTLTKSALAVGLTLLLGLAAFTAAGMGGAPEAAPSAAPSEPMIQTAIDSNTEFSLPASALAVALAQTDIESAKAADPAANDAPPPRPTALSLQAVPLAEQRIQAALESPLAANLEFFDTPLADVVDFLADAEGIPILLDTNALEEAGVSPEEPLTLILKGVRFDSALNILLGPLGLTYVVEDEVLKVTSQDVADDRREMRVYVLTHLVEGGFDAEQIKDAVQELDAEAVVRVMNGHLAVVQSQAGHRETKDLLEQLHRAASVKP